MHRSRAACARRPDESFTHRRVVTHSLRPSLSRKSAQLVETVLKPASDLRSRNGVRRPVLYRNRTCPGADGPNCLEPCPWRGVRRYSRQSCCTLHSGGDSAPSYFPFCACPKKTSNVFAQPLRGETFFIIRLCQLCQGAPGPLVSRPGRRLFRNDFRRKESGFKWR